MSTLKVGVVSALLIVGLAALLAVQRQSLNQLREENTALRSQTQEAERLRAENERLGKSQVPAEDLNRMQAERTELLRLRGEIGPLRQEKTRLDQLTRENQQLRETMNAMARQSTASSGAPIPGSAGPPALPAGMLDPQSVQNRCIANLRMITSAMQQWALEKKKTANDVPTWTDLVGPSAYLRSMPVCPAGGIYSLMAVGKPPTCTVAGHFLPP